MGKRVGRRSAKKGISLALCQTEKGKALLQGANVELLPVSIEKAINNNQQLEKPSCKPKRYELFFKMLEEGKTYRAAVKIVLPRAYRNQQIKRILIKLGIMHGGVHNKRDE